MQSKFATAGQVGTNSAPKLEFNLNTKSTKIKDQKYT